MTPRICKTILYAAFATLFVLVLFGGRAKADSNLHCSYADWYGINCTRSYTPPPRELTRDEIAEQDAKIAKWEAFCKPTKTYDSDGIGRLSYAQKGCEFGRDQ